MYCIYTDADVSEERGNMDHVYPLSLGGSNQFTVWCDLGKNSVMGSEVDGEVVNDPFMQFALRDSGVKGHGKTAHVPRWRHVKMDDRPLQVRHEKHRIVVWDARERRELSPEEYAERPMTARLKIGMHTALRFLAKAALGGGYFLYGDVFRTAIDCDPLREVIFLDIEASKQRGTLQKSQIRVCDRFHEDSYGSGPAVLYRAICELTQRSLFIAFPTASNSVSFHVGIVGQYIGSINIPAKTEDLPIDGEHDLGHAIVLGPGIMERMSFRALATDFDRAFKEFQKNRAASESPPATGQ
jgi:hypothetical protein